MATMHQTQSGVCHSKFIQRVAPECRVIVDDVDAERLMSTRDTETSSKIKTEEYDNISSLENTTARIKQIQVEAESRKIEFARLLEEHAQVIRRLKQMEESESSSHHIPNATANVTKA